MPPVDQTNDNSGKMIDLAFKVMSMLIIPVGIYIFNMGTEVKLLEQRIEVQKVTISEQKSSISELKTAVANGWNKIQLNTLELRQLREQISAQSAMLREVYEYVLRQQGGASGPRLSVQPRLPSLPSTPQVFQPLPFNLRNAPTSSNPLPSTSTPLPSTSIPSSGGTP